MTVNLLSNVFMGLDKERVHISTRRVPGLELVGSSSFNSISKKSLAMV